MLLGWTVLPAAWFWTLSILGIILIPSLIISALNLFQKPRDVMLTQHLSSALHTAGNHLMQAAFTLICLPYEAYFSIDAIGRTIWRILISHKLLLEWNPSDNPSRKRHNDMVNYFGAMWFAPAFAAVTAITIFFSRPAALAVAGPFLIIWLISPLIAYLFSRPFARREAKLTSGQIIFLRKISRKTWSFFETFVGPDDNWLPPDNYQEQPVSVVAHRTSPTNMGLALLANLSACDFGYITMRQFIERNGKYTSHDEINGPL